MDNPRHALGRGWTEKFRDAFRGVKVGVRGQCSFFFHFFMAAAVIGAGFVLGIGLLEWCIVLLCVAVVLAAEMFNTALESMARAITDEMHPDLGNALDIGSAAVLVASIGAAVVGAIVFLNRLGLLLGWWSG
jgi:diacylglycerol kinase